VRSLDDWLRYIEAQHPAAIALGLDRVSEVLGRLSAALACPVITVGGTNGKGSTCAMLESTLRAAGYRTGLYTSPHLVRYNERVRIAGLEVQDSPLCEAFAEVERLRGQIPLTYFEFGTLAALWLFARENLDAAVLEVGLGGRLDAVNAVDSDCPVLTSIGIDHVEYLGADRESIGREKAGIFRPGRPAVIAEPDPPQSVMQAAGEKLFLGKDFGYVAEANQWTYWGPGGRRASLAYPALRGKVQLRNAAAALCALDALELPITMQEIRRGLAEVVLTGRFQVLPGAAGDPRRSAQSAGRKDPGAESRRLGVRAGDDRGMRHAARQGHRRRAARSGAAHHALALRFVVRPAGSDCGRTEEGLPADGSKCTVRVARVSAKSVCGSERARE